MKARSGFSRRKFLAGSAAAGLTLWLPRASSGQAGSARWNTLDEEAWESRDRDFKILEIFLYGGLSPWETFYVDRPAGLLDWDPEAWDTSSGAWRGSFIKKGEGLEDFADGDLSFSRSFDPARPNVHLSAVTKPLWEGDDPLVDRMRVVVLQHNQAPHEGAIPLALTGLRIGNPRASGIGAAIDRHVRVGGGADGANQIFPAAYFLEPQIFSEFDAGISTGLHGAAHRPLRLPLGGGRLVGALARDNLPPAQNVYDALLSGNTAAFGDALSHHADSPLRSRGYTGYVAAQTALRHGPTLAPLVNQEDPPPGTSNFEKNLDLALTLLNREEENESVGYACAVTESDAFDAHDKDDIGAETLGKLGPVLAALRTRAQRAPGGETPRLDLDNTLVLLNTEFGRTPWWQGYGDSPDDQPDEDMAGGRNHHPRGTVNVLIGGPITSRGFAGRMTEAGSADQANCFTPTDVRACLLMAAGINPIHNDIFSVSDLSQPAEGTEKPADVLSGLRRRVFGIEED
jgi:hypothetical protein